MSGLSGHMKHIYEDLSLTRQDLYDIINGLTQGTISCKEKIDGFNIHIMMTPEGPRFARNKKDLQNAGMELIDIIKKWHDNKRVQEVYTQAFVEATDAFYNMTEKDIKALQPIIKDSNIVTLNCECLLKGNLQETNIIPYSNNLVLYIHNIWEWDLDTGKIYEWDTDDLDYLSKYVVDPIKFFDSGNIDYVRKMFLTRIDELFDNSLITAINSIEDLYKSRFIEYCYSRWPKLFDNYDGLKVLYNRYFKKDKSVNLKTLKNIYGEDFMSNMENIYYKDIYNYCITPLKNIIIDFGNYMMRCVKSGYINKNSKYECINYINAILNIHLTLHKNEAYENQLNYFNRQINPLEGIVFNHGNTTYKLTGTFSIINKYIWNN